MNNKKTGEDFKKSSIENKIWYWNFHDCSLCGYECGFLFFYYENEVVFDAGCYCTNSRTIRKLYWDDVALQYNCNIKNTELIKKYKEYWKFKD